MCASLCVSVGVISDTQRAVVSSDYIHTNIL